ncbi:MAG: sulfite oxidase heme-binding subunit YedZ [Gammaproteobacteria bacterium]
MKRPWLKPLAFLLCLLPALILLGDGLTGNLGVNPVETITHTTGDWALRLLLITLAVTPARRWLGWTWPAPLRRMLGLFSFFYVVLHFSTWFILDQGLSVPLMIADVIERPYITIGFIAFVLLIPLAATSTNGMIKRLGGKRWKALHKAVYAIGVLGVLHFLWLVKADYIEPGIYALILALLLMARLPASRATRPTATPGSASSSNGRA